MTFLRTTANLNTYMGGQLSWTDGTRTVRIPMVVRPVTFAAPAEASGSYDVAFGYDGPFNATALGLVVAEVTDAVVDQDPDQTFDPNDSTGTLAVQVSVPTGTTYARFAIFDSDVVAGSDVDMFVFGPTGSTPFRLHAWVLGGSAAGNMTVTAPAVAVIGNNETIELDFTDLEAGTKYLGSIVYGGAAGLPAPTIIRVDP